MPRVPTKSSSTHKATATDDPLALIRAMLRRVPRGCVVTYGQLAELAGFPRGARLAARALRLAPTGSKLPWYRVINAQGRLSFAPDSAAYAEQQQRLQAEGVVFIKGRIDLARYRWRPRSEAPVVD